MLLRTYGATAIKEVTGPFEQEVQHHHPNDHTKSDQHKTESPVHAASREAAAAVASVSTYSRFGPETNSA